MKKDRFSFRDKSGDPHRIGKRRLDFSNAGFPLLPAAAADANGWHIVKVSNPIFQSIYRRHYSCLDTRPATTAIGPGLSVCILHKSEKAVAIWRHYKHGHELLKDKSYLQLYRNETDRPGSELLLEAEQYVPADWPIRAVTFVCTREVKGDGKCFKVAGWHKAGRTKTSNLLVYNKLLPYKDGVADRAE